jgi:hypothetical protein
MAREVDELFGASDAPRPRTTLVVGLVVSGVLLGILGLGCTSLPGGALVLAAWNIVETESERIESGYLPLDARPHVQSLRVITYGAIAFVILLLILQGFLLCAGFYGALWGTMLDAIIGSAAPAP